jgi:hypothetical protein
LGDEFRDATDGRGDGSLCLVSGFLCAKADAGLGVRAAPPVLPHLCLLRCLCLAALPTPPNRPLRRTPSSVCPPRSAPATSCSLRQQGRGSARSVPESDSVARSEARRLPQAEAAAGRAVNRAGPTSLPSTTAEQDHRGSFRSITGRVSANPRTAARRAPGRPGCQAPAQEPAPFGPRAPCAFFTILMAQVRPVSMCVPILTLAKWPVPSSSPSRHLPMTSVIGARPRQRHSAAPPTAAGASFGPDKIWTTKPAQCRPPRPPLAATPPHGCPLPPSCAVRVSSVPCFLRAVNDLDLFNSSQNSKISQNRHLRQARQRQIRLMFHTARLALSAY